MIMDLLAELHRSRKLTSIHVTHNMSFAGRADRALRLELGQLTPVQFHSSDASFDKSSSSAIAGEQGRNYV
jgi:ABC-type lipoprotein export system ATPase subunit